MTGLLKLLSRASKPRKLRGPVLRRFLGMKDACLRGAVFSPSEPDRIFNVGLLDAAGNVMLSARADLALSCDNIPSGHGFEFPVPITWLQDGRTEHPVQFRVLETGATFPQQPRPLKLHKVMREMDLGNESAQFTQERIRSVGERLNKTLPHGVMVMASHEMTRTGAPLILLEIIRQMKARYAARVVLLCLQPAGQMAAIFHEQCEAVIDGLEGALRCAPEQSAALLSLLHSRSAKPTALVNTLCSMKIAVALQNSGFEVVSLIHEYPFAFTSEHVKKQFAASAELVFPSKDVETAFRRLGQLPRASASRPAAAVSLLPQGCYMLEQGPPSAEDVEALRTRYREEFTIRPGDRVVFACGTMDSRKGFDWFGSLIRRYMLDSPQWPKTHFIWAGRVSDEDLFFHFKHELRETGAIGNFHHLNDLADCRAAFQLADAFLLCSRIDPFPSVVLEAFASGVPVIGFDRCQGCAGLIQETGFGVVVPYLDERTAVRAVDEVLADQALRARVKESGLGFVARRFSYKRYVDVLAARMSGTAASKASPHSAERPVMLLGFHRSGTSFLSRWLAAQGVEMIPSGLRFESTVGNPDGHGEDLLFLDLHCHAMMSRHGEFMQRWGGSRCIFLPSYGDDWATTTGEAKELVLSLHTRGSWGWKDPRTLLFYDMWSGLFPEARKILLVRHPLEIMSSLLRRGTDPLVFEHPLAVFDAYVGYHKKVLESLDGDRAAWCVIQMPFDESHQTKLHAFLAMEESTDGSTTPTRVAFDPNKFHKMEFTSQTQSEFERLFPEAANTHARLLGTAGGKSLSDQQTSEQARLDWLKTLFPELAGSKARVMHASPGIGSSVLEVVRRQSPARGGVDLNTELFGGGLGLDSIGFLDLILKIEKEVGFRLRDEDLSEETLASVGSLIRHVEALAEKRNECEIG